MSSDWERVMADPWSQRMLAKGFTVHWTHKGYYFQRDTSPLTPAEIWERAHRRHIDYHQELLRWRAICTSLRDSLAAN